MKKFMQSTMQFFLYLTLMYPVFVIGGGLLAPEALKPNLHYLKGSPGHMNSRMKEVQSTRNVDLLFIGSSHACRGFDTRIFARSGLKVFNLGSSAQTPIQTEVLIRRYLDQLNPKIVVYEVYPGPFQSDGVESSLDIIANDRNDRYSILMALKTNHITTYNTLIFGYFGDLFNTNAKFTEPIHNDSDHYVTGGYVERDLAFNRDNDHPPQSWNFVDKQFEAFEEILEIIADRNMELLLVYAPITSSRYHSYDNHDEFDRIMRSYGRYLNYNLIMELDDYRHFYDPHHLNQDGVELFNGELLKELLKHPSLSSPE